ncbi:MAG TPA: S1/P1 nuclease [Luteimonas sp.]|nr:S1/P1 nuclease [Luteimonas sp.]
MTIHRLLAPTLLALALALPAAPVLAWAKLGHRIIGELAQRELTPAARAEVARLLVGEPDPTLAGVADWADTLRQSNSDRFKRTARWHYVNFPRSECAYVPERDCPDGNCAIAAIDAQRLVLADPQQSRVHRVEALKFLVHVVGDVHQPLHAGYADDRGGNGYQISLRTNIAPEAYARDHYSDGIQGTNLHAIWDYYIVATHDTDAARYADELLARPHIGRGLEPTIPNPADWAMESCNLIHIWSVYPNGHKLDAAYLQQMRPRAEVRLLQAGHRLAMLLNQSLGKR